MSTEQYIEQELIKNWLTDLKISIQGKSLNIFLVLLL